MFSCSCLCGQIRFTISGELRAARYCHCENCTKSAGTSPAAWAIADSAAMSLENPGAGVSKYNSGKGLRCFCPDCGAPVWFESLDYPDIVAIPLGVLDHGDIPAPEMRIWVRSRPDWCTITDELPQHETNPGPTPTEP